MSYSGSCQLHCIWANSHVENLLCVLVAARWVYRHFGTGCVTRIFPIQISLCYWRWLTLMWMSAKHQNWRIFNCMKSFITKHEIILEKCTDVCTDGERAMARSMKGAATQIKNVAQCSVCHGVLKWQALAIKKIKAYLKIVLYDAVKTS